VTGARPDGVKQSYIRGAGVGAGAPVSDHAVTKRGSFSLWSRAGRTRCLPRSTMLLVAAATALLALTLSPLRPPAHACHAVRPRATTVRLEVTSPFNEGSDAAEAVPVDGPLDLTLDNVELVLDTMRPYLMADGGNVAVVDIEGGIVKLELQGACGSCPSSTMTMKMGLERGLLEKIPEIIAVEQVVPSGPQLTEEGIDEGEVLRAAQAVQVQG